MLFRPVYLVVDAKIKVNMKSKLTQNHHGLILHNTK